MPASSSSICLSELMGGRTWVESEVGKGSRFSFTIHARTGSQALLAASGERRIDGAQPELAGRRVLIVDDHTASRTSLKRQVDEWGLVSWAAASSEEALNWIKEGQAFDLALIDMQMTGLGGGSLVDPAWMITSASRSRRKRSRPRC